MIITHPSYPDLYQALPYLEAIFIPLIGVMRVGCCSHCVIMTNSGLRSQNYLRLERVYLTQTGENRDNFLHEKQSGSRNTHYYKYTISIFSMSMDSIHTINQYTICTNIVEPRLALRWYVGYGQSYILKGLSHSPLFFV